MVAMRKRWLVFVTMLTIILALSSCSKPPAPSPPLPTPSPTPIPAPTPMPTPPAEVKEGLAILSHSSYVDDFGYFHLVGEVENVGSQNTEMNKITATFFDDDVTATNYTHLDILIPGQKSPFEIVLVAPPTVTNYKMETTWQVTSRQPSTHFKMGGVTLEKEERGWGYLSGQVRNTGTQKVDAVGVVGGVGYLPGGRRQGHGSVSGLVLPELPSGHVDAAEVAAILECVDVLAE